MSTTPYWLPAGYRPIPTEESDFDALPFPVPSHQARPRLGSVANQRCVVKIGDAWLVGVKLDVATGKGVPILGKRPDAIRYPSDESATKAAERLGQRFSVEPAAK